MQRRTHSTGLGACPRSYRTALWSSLAGARPYLLGRPDLTALRIAAGKQKAAASRAAVNQELDRLRAREARVSRRLRIRPTLEAHFAAYLPQVPAEVSTRAA
ncbi:hypothetical protein ACWD0A_27580 [Streptomyces sp. NPDC002867]